MANVIWSPAALSHLDGIIAWWSKKAPAFVNRILDGLLLLAEDLGEHPFHGPMVEEYEIRTLRERLLYRYRVLYRVRNDCVEIVGIYDTARLLPPDPPC